MCGSKSDRRSGFERVAALSLTHPQPQRVLHPRWLGMRGRHVGAEVVAGDVEEDRAGEEEGVEAVEHAAVAGDAAAPVLRADRAFDRGHHQAAEESGDDQHTGYGDE